MPVVLIAHGGNDLEVPCRLFPDMATALKRCTELFGRGPTSGQSWDYDKASEWDVSELLENVEVDGQYENSPLAQGLFRHYYSGCGGVSSFSLKEVAYDSVFVGFDLD